MAETTENGWNSGQLSKMVKCLEDNKLITDPQLRVFGVALARSQSAYLTDTSCRNAIEVAERLLEGTASQADLSEAFYNIGISAGGDAENRPHQLNFCATLTDPSSGIVGMTGAASQLARYAEGSKAIATQSSQTIVDSIRTYTATKVATDAMHIMREVWGPNPLNPPCIDPAWMTDTVCTFVRSMRDSGDLSPMPVLGDAMQDAGCDNDDILNYLRDVSKPHIRHNWFMEAATQLLSPGMEVKGDAHQRDPERDGPT